LVYDPGDIKYRPAAIPAWKDFVWPNVPLWAYDAQSGDPYIAPLLHDNIFVKLAGGDGVLATHNVGQTPNQNGGGMTSWTAAEVNAKNGTTDTGGLWRTRGNVKHATLGAAGFDSGGNYTGQRFLRKQRGCSARGY
jgi:hypothetical protein